MKTLFSIAAGILAGLLCGWLGGRLSGGSDAATATVTPPSRKPATVQALPGTGGNRARSPQEELRHWMMQPAGIRNAIRLEQAAMRLTEAESLGMLRVLDFKESGLAARILGWQAAGTHPEAALEAADQGAAAKSRAKGWGEAPPGGNADSETAKAGILSRWLDMDLEGALAACQGNEKHWTALLQQWAETDPAAFADFLLREPASMEKPLLESWTARNPAAALGWTTTHHPEWIGALLHAWMRTDAPSALPAAFAQDWGQPHPSPLDDGLANGFMRVAEANPGLAAATLRQLDFNGEKLKLIYGGSFIRLLAGYDLSLALDLAASAPSQEIRDQFTADCVMKVFEADPNAALELARTVRTPALRDLALANIVHHLGEIDPRSAEPLFEELSPEWRATAMTNLLDNFDTSAPALAEKCRQWLRDYQGLNVSGHR